MIFFKRISDFILFGNIYVALGAVCLIQSTVIQIGSKDHLIFYSALTFFATLFVYNLQRIFYIHQKDISLNSIRRRWISENQFSIRSLCVTGFIGVAITFFFNDPKIIFYLSPLLILSIAYFLPTIKLRQNAWFKLLTLAIVWTTATALLPIILNNINLFSTKSILHFFVQLSFMVGICIPFDIRDHEIDKVDNINTLPHIFGEQKTRWIAVTIMLIYIFLIALEYQIGMLNIKTGTALLFSAIINGTLVLLSGPKRSEYFYVAGIDGTMILQGTALMLAHSL